MKFFVIHHQHKAKPLEEALLNQGWRKDTRNPDIVLADRDFATLGKTRGLLELFHSRGAKILIYPHSALIPWWYDGMTELNKNVEALLVSGEAHVEAMKLILPDARVEKIGWYYSPMKPWRSNREVKKILFAPTHPVGRVLRPEALDLNRRIHNDLVKLSDKYRVVVRHVFSLQDQGIKYNPRITYQTGKLDGSYRDIDSADVVIAEGTFMYIAVSRGAPVIGYGQDVAPRPNRNPNGMIPKRFDEWKDIVSYPINYGEAPLETLITRAVEKEQTEWKERNLGVELEAKDFSGLMGRIANG